MYRNVINNVVAERSSTDEGCVNITFDVKCAKNIIAYEVYSLSDRGEKTRRSFQENSRKIVMKDLAKDVGYKFEVQAVYSDESISLSAQSNHIDGVTLTCATSDAHQSDHDSNSCSDMKRAVIECYYKMGDKIKKGKHVFKGQFSYVFKNSGSRQVAIKALSASDYEILDRNESRGEELSLKMKRMVREAKHMLELIDHPNVVQYIHSCPESNKPSTALFYIFMELCSEKTLADRISNVEFHDGSYCRAVILHLALAVNYMHRKGIYHRDIKPSNILFTENGRVVKISDFGFSKMVKSTNGSISSTTSNGTDGYRPPETYDKSKKGKVTDRGDVFSLGLVYFYILTQGKHPFGSDVIHQQSNICDEKKQPNTEGLKGMNAALAKDLIEKMIIKSETTDRPKMDEVLKHPYFWSARQIISFYVKVHDSLSEESPMRTDQSRSSRPQNHVISDVMEFVCAARTIAEAAANRDQAHTQKIVEQNLLENGFCKNLHRDASDHIKMVQDICEKLTSTLSVQFNGPEAVERFFIAAQTAAISNDFSGPEERLIEYQRSWEEKLLSGSYFSHFSKNAQHYIKTIHKVLKRLDERAGPASEITSSDSTCTESSNEEILDEDDEKKGNDVAVSDDENSALRYFEERQIKDGAENYVRLGTHEALKLPDNSHSATENLEDDFVRNVVTRLLEDQNIQHNEACWMLKNLSRISLTVHHLISTIDSLDPVQFARSQSGHGPALISIIHNMQFDTSQPAPTVKCRVGLDIPLRTEYISVDDRVKLTEATKSLIDEICSPQKTSKSVLAEGTKFINLYEKVTEEGTGNNILAVNAAKSSSESLLHEELNNLEVKRKKLRSKDWQDFNRIMSGLEKTRAEEKQTMFKNLIATVSQLSHDAENGSRRTWKQCFVIEGKRHKDKCGNCCFFKLAECAQRHNGDDIFGLVTYIRNRLVHFEVEKTKRDGVWMEKQEDILVFVATAVPELLMHMVNIMKGKDDVRKFIEDNKQTNSSFQLPSVPRDDQSGAYAQPFSDI